MLLGGICGDALVWSDLGSRIHSALSQRGLAPVPPPWRPPALLTASACFFLPYTSTCLPLHPRAAATYSYLFPTQAGLSPRWKPRIIPSPAPKYQPLPICCLRASPQRPRGRRRAAAPPAILCAARGKGSRLSGGTAFGSPAANWAMLL